MICQECGADNPDSAEFCNLCHNRFAGTHVNPAAEPQPGHVFVPGSPVFTGSPGPSDVPQALSSEGSAFTQAPPPPAGEPPPAAEATGFELAPEALQEVDVMPPPPPPLMPSRSGFKPPPSEWGAEPYIESTYGRLTKPSPARKGPFASPLGKLLPVIILFVFFVGAYYGVGYMMGGGTSTYTSTQSDLTFQYPASWKRLNAGEFSGLSGVAGIELYNEVLLADSTSDSMKYFVGAGSIEMPPEQWEARKAELRAQFGGNGTGAIPQGSVSMTGSTVTDTTIGGADALDIKFSVASMGYDFDCRAVVISHMSKMYMLLFMTRGDKSSAAAQVQKVVDSIKFKNPVK